MNQRELDIINDFKVYEKQKRNKKKIGTERGALCNRTSCIGRIQHSFNCNSCESPLDANCVLCKPSWIKCTRCTIKIKIKRIV